MLEVWVELHQSWLCTGLPLNKTTKNINTRKKSVHSERVCSRATLGNAILLSSTRAWNVITCQSTNQGKSSKIGLVLVLNMAMIAGRPAACGSPEREHQIQRLRWVLKIKNNITLIRFIVMKRRGGPLRSTASLSPVGSQAKDWISPPTLADRADSKWH